MNRFLFVIVSVIGLPHPSCSTYSANPSVSRRLPSRESFPALSAVLEPHCGTLDCHGSPARNLRVYGIYGLRATGDNATGGADTTEADVDATYASLVSLQPEVLGALFEANGQNPQQWIVVTKSRGSERHEGGGPLPPGSPGDRCLVSWASGALDASACAADFFGPEPRPGQTW